MRGGAIVCYLFRYVRDRSVKKSGPTFSRTVMHFRNQTIKTCTAKEKGKKPLGKYFFVGKGNDSSLLGHWSNSTFAFHKCTHTVHRSQVRHTDHYRMMSLTYPKCRSRPLCRFRTRNFFPFLRSINSAFIHFLGQSN